MKFSPGSDTFRFRPCDFEKVAKKYKEFSTLAAEQTGYCTV